MSKQPKVFTVFSPDGGESVVLEARTRRQLLHALCDLLEPDAEFMLTVVNALWRGRVVTVANISMVVMPGLVEVVGLPGRPVLRKFRYEV